MSRLALVLALALLVLQCAAGGANAAEANAERILVTFDDPGMSKSARAGPVRPGYSRRTSTYLVSIGVRRTARRIEREFGLRQLDEWPIVPLKVHCIVYAVDNSHSIDKLLNLLRADPRVESAQRMNTFEVLGNVGPGPNAYRELQHSAVSLQLEAAHRWSRGRGTRVAIVDTGADLLHPDIRQQIEAHRNFVDEQASEFNADMHGTAIAGIIGASADDDFGIVGVAPSATLTVVKACWYPEGSDRAVCDSFTLARALSFVIESDADVINLSLSGPEDPLLERLLGAAIRNNQIVIAAAPPSANVATFPASLPGAIIVDAAEDAENARRGRFVHAPGRDILVPVPGGGFDFASGSSLSAAHVSGIVALLLSRQPRLTRDDVSALLDAAEDPVRRSVSACRALANLIDRHDCPVPSLASKGAP